MKLKWNTNIVRVSGENMYNFRFLVTQISLWKYCSKISNIFRGNYVSRSWELSLVTMSLLLLKIYCICDLFYRITSQASIFDISQITKSFTTCPIPSTNSVTSLPVIVGRQDILSSRAWLVRFNGRACHGND